MLEDLLTVPCNTRDTSGIVSPRPPEPFADIEKTQGAS